MPRTPPPRPPVLAAGQWLVQVAAYAKLHLQTVINTYYYLVTQPTPTVAQLNEVSAGWISAVMPVYGLAVSSQVTHYQTIARFMGRPDVPSVTTPITTGGGGNISTPSLPSTDAAIITCFSTFGGKRGRARKYIFGIPQTAETNSALTAGELALLNNLATAIAGPVPTGDFGSVPAWMFSRNKTGEAGVAGVAISSAAPVAVIGTQRRRRIGRGI